MRVAFPDILRFSFKFGPIPVLPFFSGGILDLPRTELSSAASQNCFVLCIVELGPQLSSAWAFGFSRSNWAWPLNYWAPQWPLKTLLPDFLVGKEGFGKPGLSVWLI